METDVLCWGVRRGCCCSAGADPGCAPCREEWLAPSAVSWPGARPPRCSPPRARGCWPRATCWASTTSVLLCTRRGSSTRPGKGRGRAGREVTPAERHSPRACHGWAVRHQTPTSPVLGSTSNGLQGMWIISTLTKKTPNQPKPTLLNNNKPKIRLRFNSIS